jgi:hypothetical protein
MGHKMMPLGNGKYAGKGGKMHTGTPDGLRPDGEEAKNVPPRPQAKKSSKLPPPPPAMKGKKSPTFESKLDAALRELLYEIPDIQLGYLLQQATSPTRFENQQDLRRHLSEGALLGVSTLASSYLGIPNGEYLVYRINSDKAVLVPVSADSDLVESGERFELLTPALMQHWDKLERCLAEAQTGNKDKVQQQASKYPRNRQARGAIEASGRSQEDVAHALGVDPSTVSRWTIDHQDGGRKPTIDHAVALSKMTGQDVPSLFGSVVDIPAGGSMSKKRKSTSGSGGGRNPTYQAGNETGRI